MVSKGGLDSLLVNSLNCAMLVAVSERARARDLERLQGVRVQCTGTLLQEYRIARRELVRQGQYEGVTSEMLRAGEGRETMAEADSRASSSPSAPHGRHDRPLFSNPVSKSYQVNTRPRIPSFPGFVKPNDAMPSLIDHFK